ncbi:uncharacterized protein BX663DRAFT_552858 [Cokeromyces recurvatus]|uniref:uncharacterized protein n=1 Tax=Cokeromyces recurvatus TaxID=90255 RepID=UPI00221E93EC|nr:uncharacterized protein BX663DRAFT_552858 [Cokeromyces recurvatus]KAI7901961.1 hypothetical protein BX663DRAFT_552858 [Cokeromyces recurvatus]
MNMETIDQTSSSSSTDQLASKEEMINPSEVQDVDSMAIDDQTKEAETTIRAYDELLELQEKLAEDNSLYDIHVKFIGLLKELELTEQLEVARISMHDVFPLSEALWLDWINDTKKEANTPEGQAKLFKLYNEAQEDYQSIIIWKDYVDYILQRFNDQSTNNDDVDKQDLLIEETREQLLKAVHATQFNIKQSQEIWKAYSEFELRMLDQNKEDSEQLARVRKMYLDRLAVLHLDYEDTFNAYSSFISNYDNLNYEQSMVEANKIYAKTKVAAEERDVFELKLATSGYHLDSFYEYIEYEKRLRNKSSLNHIRSLYERAIIYYCTDANLWNDYILFLLERARIQSFLETICIRAIRNCPWSGILWAHLGRLLESGGKPEDQIDDIFDRALASKPILSSLDDLVTVLLAKCDFKRRRVDWEDVDEDAVLNLRLVFEESLEILNEAFPDSGDPYFRIEKYYAYILVNRLGDNDKARKIWSTLVEKQGLNTEAWIQYILFERDQGNYTVCSSLFKQAIQKNIDNPARLMDVWDTVEHEIGTLESYEIALVKMNRKTKRLTKQWEIQYAKEEEEEAKQKEKFIMERKKKSAHRLAQKQRAKEKKASERNQFKKPIEKAFKEDQHKLQSDKETVFNDREDDDQEEEQKEVKEIQAEENNDTQENEKEEENNNIQENEKEEENNDIQENEKEEEKKNEKIEVVNTQLSHKRKLSVDNSLEDSSDSKKKYKRNTQAPQPSFNPKPRGLILRRGKALNLGRRAVNRNLAPRSANKEKGDATEEKKDVPKSNDDFRSMLLGKK